MSDVANKTADEKPMETGKRLNRALWYNIARLKLMDKPDASTKFVLEKSPFNDYSEEEIDEGTYEEQDQYVIIGRIFPQSEIYKNGLIKIEMIVASNYPEEPPRVRFLTPIYHPNIEADGKFCHQLISNKSRWVKSTTLVAVVEAVVKHLDDPDPDYAVTYEIGREYMNNREEFIAKAKKSVEACLIPPVVEKPTESVNIEPTVEMDQTENFETVMVDETVEEPVAVSTESETNDSVIDENHNENPTVDPIEEVDDVTVAEEKPPPDLFSQVRENCTIC